MIITKIKLGDSQILAGDPLRVLARIPTGSIQAIITSVPRPEFGLDAFLDRASAIFAKAKRVLRRDATLWLHVGDGYAAPRDKNIKPGNLLGIPWRLVLRLQADGWYLRTEIICQIRNAMPEHIRDRPTRAHEYVFLLSPNRHYYYRQTELLEPSGQNKRSVWLTAKRNHDGFPAGVVKSCVEVSTRPGDYVLDPFMISPAVQVAIEAEGRKYLGIQR